MNNIIETAQDLDEILKGFAEKIEKIGGYENLTQDEKYEISIQRQSILMAEAIFRDMPYAAGTIGDILLSLHRADIMTRNN